nr:sugar transferase [Lachnospiraceae bacterium]
MSDFRHDLLLRTIKLGNAVLMTVPFAVSWMVYYGHQLYLEPFFFKGNWLVIVLYFLVYAMYGRVYDAFLVSLNPISEMVYSQSLAAAVSDVIAFIVIWLLMLYYPNVVPMFIVFAAQIAVSAGWSVAVHRWYFRTFPPKRTIVVYDMREGMEELIAEYGLSKKFDVREIIPVDECIEGDLGRLKAAEAVYLCGIHSRERNIILKYCIKEGITVYVIPRIGDILMSGAKKMHMFHLPVMRVDRYSPPPEYVFTKRLIDVLVSLFMLLIFAPVMLVTAAAIKIEDRGPVFYKQVRLTKDGRKFKVLKFRSMKTNAESDGVARLSSGSDDDRVTKVGKVIRKFRIDELPQLINVLAGSMSLVGPRPERPEIAKQYEKELPEFALRLQAKAGLTGLAQVYGKYNTSPYDKL